MISSSQNLERNSIFAGISKIPKGDDWKKMEDSKGLPKERIELMIKINSQVISRLSGLIFFPFQ